MRARLAWRFDWSQQFSKSDERIRIAIGVESTIGSPFPGRIFNQESFVESDQPISESGLQRESDVVDEKSMPLEAANPAFDPALSNKPTSSPYGQLFGFAIGYALILFCCVLALGDSFLPIIPAIAFIFATVLMVAAWSVFGPGSYLDRMYRAHLFGMIPATGLLFALLILSIGERDGIRIFCSAMVIGLLTAIPVSLGAQLPFWFFRCLFGWQFVFQGNLPARSFDLKDVFVITFVFAFSFAVPPMASNIQSRLFPGSDLGQGSITVEEMVVQPDGSSISVKRVLSSEEAFKRRELDNRMSAYAGYGVAIGAEIVATLLSIPIVVMMFRTKVVSTGCGLIVLYVFCLGTISMGVLIGLGGSSVFVYVAILLGLCVGALAIPLMFARESGIQLTSPNQIAQKSC